MGECLSVLHGQVGIHALAQRLPGLKWGASFSGIWTCSPLRVAAHARRAAADGEAAKAPDLDAMAARQGVAHGVEDGLDREFGVTLGQLRKAVGEQVTRSERVMAETLEVKQARGGNTASLWEIPAGPVVGPACQPGA